MNTSHIESLMNQQLATGRQNGGYSRNFTLGAAMLLEGIGARYPSGLYGYYVRFKLNGEVLRKFGDTEEIEWPSDELVDQKVDAALQLSFLSLPLPIRAAFGRDFAAVREMRRCGDKLGALAVIDGLKTPDSMMSQSSELVKLKEGFKALVC
jgi:hypothetical protein